MRGPEGDFWRKVRRAWPGHSVRIEASDGEVETGTPDCVLSLGFRGGFIELKVWPDVCSPVQLAWHREAISRGAYVMVLADMKDRSVWLGPGEDWNEFVGRDGAIQLGMHLSGLREALSVIAFALTGVAMDTGIGETDGMVGCSTKGSRRSTTA